LMQVQKEGKKAIPLKSADRKENLERIGEDLVGDGLRSPKNSKDWIRKNTWRVSRKNDRWEALSGTPPGKREQSIEWKKVKESLNREEVLRIGAGSV